MKAGLLFICAAFISHQLIAQDRCASFAYQQQDASSIQQVEKFITNHIADALSLRGETVYQIPVVVHILYHDPSQKINDSRVFDQLTVLNNCFRRRNADSSNTPSIFKPYAADCDIEFVLAKSDSKKRATTGIIKKYTPITSFKADDKVKFSASYGDDAWDTDSYLNIWVCNLDKLAGYASFPGGPKDKDGIVLDFDAFGITATSGYGMGKTAVHEAGHWLGLNHIWGDASCGDDHVDDTPKQASYTAGCPSGTRITCGNAPTGDMYMNYMDFTSDQCINLFTVGQKNRMRSLFVLNGPRAALLSSKGLSAPLFFDAPIADADPTWLHPQLYPNPTNGIVNIDLAYDARWMGTTINVTNIQGVVVKQTVISSKLQQVNLDGLKPGMYFISAKKQDGEGMMFRVIRQ